MIDWKMSAERNDMSIDELKARFIRFPSSVKKVFAICDMCGRGHETHGKWSQAYFM